MIAHVYVFTNGMAMVFDDQGQQMSQYQGPWSDKRQQILDASTPETKYELSQWDEWTRELSKDAISRLSIEVPK